MQPSFDPLDPVVIEYAYRRGFFPMPHPESGEVLWYDPDPRAVFFLDKFHISRSLQKSLRKKGYTCTFDTAFEKVVNKCADRDETWINADFIRMYLQMFGLGKAHSVEIWSDGELVGGVFGLCFGGVFNGESMFSTAVDASKIALFMLVEAMKNAKMHFLEVQFMTPHLASLGAEGVARDRYHALLEQALLNNTQLTHQHFKTI